MPFSEQLQYPQPDAIRSGGLGRVHEFDQLPSTNAFALAHLAELRHGDVIVARIQTAGRGRLDRAWISHHPGNLALSIILKPPITGFGVLPAATHYMAVVLCRTLESDGLVPVIKWPNDVQVGGRKIAGILAEAHVEGDRCQGLALGLGVNLNLPDAVLAAIDQPATALNSLLDRPVDSSRFLARLLDCFFDGLDVFLRGGFESVRHEYERRAPFLGRRITVRQPAGDSSGTARALDGNGALWLETDGGQRRLLHAGDLISFV
jgi:BirA family transcriptional regulator, biotin operon repressor / biotin---[acetyl-CoA-carboxylase] ligase